MNFKNVTKYKEHLILKCPVYFSDNLFDFIQENNPLTDNPINLFLTVVIGSIYSKRISGSSAELLYFLRNKTAPESYKVIVFSAILEREECIICTLCNDTNFSNEEDILLANPFIRKSRLELKHFFSEIQGREILFHLVNAARLN